MIDTSIIRQQYASYETEQLIAFALKEGHKITPDAFMILKEEFVKRKIDLTPLETSQQHKQAIQEQQIEALKQNEEEFINFAWEYALTGKRYNAPDAKIHAGLVELGLDDTAATKMIEGLHDKAKEIFDLHDSKMLKAGIFFILGLIVTIYTYAQALYGGYFIVAWSAIIFGAIRFFKGLSGRNVYKKIMKNIARSL